MAKVILMSGIPGSGKSTIAKSFKGATIVSADHWFERTGVYQFNPAELGTAHGNCLRKFVATLINATDHLDGYETVVVVDNTNTSVVELAPYVALAQAYGATIELINVKCDPEVAHKRNVHGVPLQGIKRMAEAIEARELPRFWDTSSSLSFNS